MDVIEFFNNTCDHEDDWTANGWSSWETQQGMFSVLSHILAGNSGSVLDVGCGTGCYYRFLQQRLGQKFPLWKYTGIDINPKMVERARRENEDIDVSLRDVMDHDGPPHDYVIGAGTFNVRIDGDQTLYLQQRMEKMFSLAKRGVALSLLSRDLCSEEHQQETRDQLFFYDAPSVLLACLHYITPNVKLDHTSLPSQFIVYLHKDG